MPGSLAGGLGGVPHTRPPAAKPGFSRRIGYQLLSSVELTAPVIDDYNFPDFTSRPEYSSFFGFAIPDNFSNGFRCNGSSSSAYWNATQFGPDCEAYTTLVSWGAGGDVRIGVRSTPGGSATYYAADAKQSGGITIIRSLSGTEVNIASFPGYTLQAGDKIGIRARGSQISLWVKPSGGAHWILQAEADDTNITSSGYAMLYLENSATLIDDLAVQTIPAAPAADQTVSPPVATGSASAPVPTLQLQVPPPVATATASAPLPTVQDRVSPGVATAAASAPLPTLQVRLLPAAATASASAKVPAVPAIGAPTARAFAESRTWTGPAVKSFGLTYDLGLSTIRSRLDQMVADGCQHIKASMAWPDAERTQGVFTWTSYDNVLTEATARGLTVSWHCIGQPDWSGTTAGTPNGGGFWGEPFNAGQRTDYGDFVTALVTRYGTQVAWYEVWNEPDQGTFMANHPDPPDPPQGDNWAAEYGQMLYTFYTAAKAVDPNVKICAPQMSHNAPAFLDRIYDQLEILYGVATCRANNYFFDYCGIHPYCDTDSPSTTGKGDATSLWGAVKTDFTDWSYVQARILAREGRTKSIVLNEFGYSTTSGSVIGPVADATRATYVASAYSLARADPNVLALTWYDIFGGDAGTTIEGTATETAYKAVAKSPAPLQVQTAPPAATASASAPLPAVQLRVSPPAATANASALVPTITAAALVSPPASTATASSPIAAVQLRVSPAAATASASAPIPTVTVAALVSPPAATANASAPLPTLQIQVPAPAATASASGPTPAVQLRVSPAVATASASAPTPTVTSSAGVAPPVATASATAPIPALQLALIPPAATASASAPVPIVGGGVVVSPPASTSAASSPTSTLQLRVSPPAATSSATAPLPIVRVSPVVFPPAAVANATALVPVVIGQAPATPPITVRTFVVGATGRTGILQTSSGETHATGLSGKTVV